jgi:NAD-dependent dihydropyrimidine dehydrogenase PreA subunit
MLRKIITIDEDKCNGCGLCAGACAEGAIEILNGKARLVKDSYCDGLGACIGECPQGALTIIEREADAFDEAAVAGHQAAAQGAAGIPDTGNGIPDSEIRNSKFEILSTGAGGCPSAGLRTFQRTCDDFNSPSSYGQEGSALTHWPVQVRLVPPTAPFLKGAHLLVAADCTAFACGGFHRDLLKGKVLMVGCPKFDDAEEYVRKFVDIFRQADIRAVTVAIMEVPCCSKLPPVVAKGMELAGKKIPLDVAVVGVRGDLHAGR